MNKETSKGTWSPSKLKKEMAKAKADGKFESLTLPDAALKVLEEAGNSPVRHVKLPNARDHDIQFNIANNLLYAHRAVVAVRCPNLLVKACKEKTVKKGIYRVNVDDRVVDEYSLHAILWYLYTDDVQFSQMENTQVVKLVLIAEMYELERLVWYCARYLQAIISVDNFFGLLKVAAQWNVVRAKVLCMEFGCLNFKELIQKKDGVAALGLELFREFVVYKTIPPSTTSQNPEEVHHKSTIQDDFKKVFTDMQFTDVVARLSGEKDAVRCHAAFLLEQSENLGKALIPAKDVSDDGREQRELELPKNAGVSAGAFRAMLRFAYYSDLNIDPVHAAELIPFARHFDIPPLYTRCEEIIKTGINVESVVPILSLCYNKDVKQHVKKDVHKPALEYAVAQFTSIDFKALRKKGAALTADILKLCQYYIEKGVWKAADEVEKEPSTPVRSGSIGSVGGDETPEGSGEERISRRERRRNRLSLIVSPAKEDASKEPQTAKADEVKTPKPAEEPAKDIADKPTEKQEETPAEKPVEKQEEMPSEDSAPKLDTTAPITEIEPNKPEPKPPVEDKKVEANGTNEKEPETPKADEPKTDAVQEEKPKEGKEDAKIDTPKKDKKDKKDKKEKEKSKDKEKDKDSKKPDGNVDAPVRDKISQFESVTKTSSKELTPSKKK